MSGSDQLCTACGRIAPASGAAATEVRGVPACAACGQALLDARNGSLTLTCMGNEGRPRPVGQAPLSEAFLEAYALGPLLGTGAMGMVMQARHRATGHDVAVKFLAPFADDSVVRRFLREARLLASLRHPNVLRIREVGVAGGHVFIVSELARCGSLRDVILDRPLSSDEAIKTAIGALRGLAQCHMRGIVHRDLKPENIVMGPLWQAIVADLSIAREDGADDLAEQGVRLGTPQYMAPEQVNGAVATPAADIYAMGLILYELLSGRPPFAGSREELFHAHLAVTPAPLSALIPEVPGPLSALIVRALSKHPRQRPADARQFEDELRSVTGKLDLVRAAVEAGRLWPPPVEDPAEGPPRLSAGLAERHLPPFARIGRERPSEVLLPGTRVSSAHALYVESPAGPLLLDLKSSNGTYVRGGAISWWLLEPGDDVQLADQILIYRGMRPPPAAPSSTARLLYRAEGRPVTFDLESTLTWIGRSPGNQIRFEDRRVSWWHALIVRAPDGRHLLLDLRSSNGTHVGRTRIAVHELCAGDLLQIGGEGLRFELPRSTNVERLVDETARAVPSRSALPLALLSLALRYSRADVLALCWSGDPAAEPPRDIVWRSGAPGQSADAVRRWPGSTVWHGRARDRCLATGQTQTETDVPNWDPDRPVHACLSFQLPFAGLMVPLSHGGRPFAALTAYFAPVQPARLDTERDLLESLAAAMAPHLARAGG